MHDKTCRLHEILLNQTVIKWLLSSSRSFYSIKHRLPRWSWHLVCPKLLTRKALKSTAEIYNLNEREEGGPASENIPQTTGIDENVRGSRPSYDYPSNRKQSPAVLPHLIVEAEKHIKCQFTLLSVVTSAATEVLPVSQQYHHHYPEDSVPALGFSRERF